MKLDEHVPVHVLEPKHSEYHAPSDDDIQEDKTAVTPPPPRHRGARISVRPQTPMAASTQALIDSFAAGSSLFLLPPTNPAYDQAPLGHRSAMIRMRDDIPEEVMPPWRRFVFTAPPPGCLIRCPGHDTQTITRAANRAEDVGALQASEHRMMTSIEEVNLRAYLSFKAQNRALLARLETLETHISRMEWQRQSAEDLVVTQMMRIHALEARAQTDTVEDADSSCHKAAYAMTWGTPKKKMTYKYYPKVYTQRFQELALMCTKFLTDETEKVNKYISGLPKNIHGNVMSARPKTLNETIELVNDLMDQKLRTYAERQNENKRKADDTSRNNQQQPHKKQNVAMEYTAGPGEKK
nr:hypothetical protein [Tanacetum cinerariifolium]